jgi:hypothetical protein
MEGGCEVIFNTDKVGITPRTSSINNGQAIMATTHGADLRLPGHLVATGLLLTTIGGHNATHRSAREEG